MKSKLYTLFAILFLALIFSSCEESNNDDGQQINGQLTNNSDCKNDLKSANLLSSTPDSLSCIEYSFDEEKNILSLKHINAGFNCCPGSLSCKVKLKGDTILIQEFEKTAQCNCNCLYDLDIEVNGVNAEIYQIKFIEPYADGQDELIFEVNLSQYSNGTYCVTRKQYPWGMYSIND